MRLRGIGFVLLLIVLVVCGSAGALERQRVVVMTDIGGDPDDIQSMVRFLLYSCDFDVEGFCTGFGHGHSKDTRPELIERCVRAYGKVLANLRKHRDGYPTAQRLIGLIKDGHNGDPHKVGPGMDSQASDWIIKVVDAEDDRPVWFTIWGGPRELAQAIWKVSQTRSAEELTAFKRKIRVHSIADQDRTAEWVKQNHPDVFWMFSNALFRGIWKEGDQEIVSPAWLEKNVRTGHGPLGPEYPAKASGKDGVKEGDTPSYFYVLPNGLSDSQQPEWGNWGGRFRRSGRGNEYVPAEDFNNGRRDMLYSIHRWRSAYQNAFEARMDWCVRPYDRCNHEPKAVVNGGLGIDVIRWPVDPGAKITLNAMGSSDPDGDKLSYKWWVYEEAGSYWSAAPISDAGKMETLVTIPQDASGRSIHVILEVSDNGSPSLTAYRRVVFDVSGKPVEIPIEARPDDLYMSTPIRTLSGPKGDWEFYRGVNINGPAATIDGNKWAGDDAKGFVCKNKAIDNPNVALRPLTDPDRGKMIHSFRWDRQVDIALTDVAKGRYAVYVYVWEETSPETFDISLEGRVVSRDFDSGVPGCWRRLGPWEVSVSDGDIAISSQGGAANFSGIELYRAK